MIEPTKPPTYREVFQSLADAQGDEIATFTTTIVTGAPDRLAGKFLLYIFETYPDLTLGEAGGHLRKISRRLLMMHFRQIELAF